MNNVEFTVDGLLMSWTDLSEGDETSDGYLILNELLTNAQAEEREGKIFIDYEVLQELEEEDRKLLKIPSDYPFDVYIDTEGAGLTDTNLFINYHFQDFAGELGNGQRVFKKTERTFAHLDNGALEYVLTTAAYSLVSYIDKTNAASFESRNESLQAVAELQRLAILAGAVMHRTLAQTVVEVPDEIKLDVKEIGENKFRLIPVFEHSNEEFNRKFEEYSRVKESYNFSNDGKRVRIVLPQDKPEVQQQLEHIKVNETVDKELLIEIAKNPSKYWDPELIDLSLFDERVVELGIYEPKFYPFVSAYKSQWVPGVAIDDGAGNVRKITIETEGELEAFEKAFQEAVSSGHKEFEFKEHAIPNNAASGVIKAAKKQFENPDEPIDEPGVEIEEKPKEKVLIIKENTDVLEFGKGLNGVKDLTYKLETIPNLAGDIELKQHQKNGVAILQTVSKEPYEFPGILLADDMGLGKTLQVLSFIEWYLGKNNTKPVLIVAPVSLLENWMQEYDRFFPESSVQKIVLWGAAVKEIVYPNDISRTKEGFVSNAVYLTTYETLRIYQIPFGMIDWSLMILDEAQKVKTPGTLVTNAAKAMKADFKLAMTGTPVENTLVDLWCIMDFCIPGLLGDAKAFAREYQNPQKSTEVDLDELGQRLRKKLGDTIIRRMKEDIKAELPEINYEVLTEEMPVEQLRAYNEALDNVTEGRSGEAIRQIHELKQISDHPYLKVYRIDAMPADEWINSSAKLIIIFKRLRDIQLLEEKVIIFTENKAMQRLIQYLISKKFDLTTAIVNGETPSSKKNSARSKLSRQQEVDKFQKLTGFNAIIMSPLAAGFGLNVTGANHVIHYTRHWNPAKEQQATDRAYRIGQQKDVKVYYPLAIAPGDQFRTFDQVLDELLSRKKGLANSALFPTAQIEVNVDDFLNGMTGRPIMEPKEELPIQLDFIDSCNPEYFEAIVAVVFAKHEVGIAYLTPRSGDKGVDVIIFADQGNMVIQVKHTGDVENSIGQSAIQEINTGLKYYEKKLGRQFKKMAVTNTEFNDNAIEIAGLNQVGLTHRTVLKRLLKETAVYKSEVDRLLSQDRLG